MKSIFFRYFRMTAMLLFASIFTIGIGFVGLIQNYVADQRQKQLEQYAQTVFAYAKQAFSNDSTLREHDPSFRMTMEVIAEISTAHIIYVNTESGGNAITFQSSNNELVTAKGSFESGLITKVVTDKQLWFYGTLSGYFTTSHITKAIPVTDGSQYVGVIFISIPMSSTRMITVATIRFFLLVSCVVIVVAAVSAYLLTKRMLRPLRDMRNAVARFSLGDFDARVPEDCHHRDEISELATAFNSMAVSLEKSEAIRSGFIANVSHEMRTPMTNVLGYINGILDGTLPSDRTPQYLTIIRDEMQRLSRLIQRMLDITRLQSSEYEINARPVELSELTARVLLSFEPKIVAKQLTVDADLQDGAWCMADKDAITQVCFNLIDNAIKFATPSSQLTLTVQTESGKVWFAITNEGAEIPADDLPLIFDRFHKADHSRANDPSGLGLGLYLVKTIVNSHHEFIYAASENGKTTFKFSLPICPKPPAQ